MPKKKIEHYAQLKAMERLMCKTTRGVTDEDVANAKSVPIKNLFEFREVKNLRRGFSAICPFHTENTGSFYVRDNRFNCFGCGVKGDSIDFYGRLNNLKFYEAVQQMVKI